ncbi:sugar lactone lactonase YvrE [Litorimonas taeanensis]|uniref:Sugar lactone lactonase YvrE n=1 Tax=Litorimonas taeanensis TaxID=568099 RepID=A0A420WEM8_9PROT|nr:strictosidine synthase family protein [Litorimonas taeanensis]RKQ69385.1 sugar lactone lactonase YvrE [Litorimonas taeanensis]
MKTALKLLVVFFIGIILYLLFFPVPISPRSWQAPIHKGYIGAFSPNTGLENLAKAPLPEGIHGPEDIVEMEGELYLSSQTGWILKFDPLTDKFIRFANTGGSPLGMESMHGKLIIADPYVGLVSVDGAGTLEVLSNMVAGTPILYADDLDITSDGLIYFSDASTKFGARAIGSTLAASLLEIMEHGETGRLLAYNPSDKTTHIVADNLAFSNGVARAPNGTSVWVVETGKYRVLEISPKGERKVIIDNLPGFPDNINRGPNGTYFIGLVSKRAKALDSLANKPKLREIIWRLPEFMKPKAQDYGFVLQIDSSGEVLRTWQDADGVYPATTGALVVSNAVVGDRLYVSSLASKTLGYRPYP